MFMKIKDFNNFLNENQNSTYKLYIEEDDSLFEDWKLIIDFTDLWDSYSNKQIDINTFINKYKLRVNEYKDQIKNIGNDVWNNLVIILNNFKDYDKSTMYKKLNEVYDWADENNVEIKIK